MLGSLPGCLPAVRGVFGGGVCVGPEGTEGSVAAGAGGQGREVERGGERRAERISSVFLFPGAEQNGQKTLYYYYSTSLYVGNAKV